jgi:hypothetical protein
MKNPSANIFAPPPLYTIYEGGKWPQEMLNEADEYVCPHCEAVGQCIRLYFWIDEVEQIDHAGLACTKCRKLGCYMEVIMVGNPIYQAWQRLQGNGAGTYTADIKFSWREKISQLYPAMPPLANAITKRMQFTSTLVNPEDVVGTSSVNGPQHITLTNREEDDAVN